ncbi:DNA-directed DNA polymerase II small subunit [Candidatus Woesearchaeota archaeon]|nr:DNA-directed DNA polymerase II small subunit [Candidatus Woesearchaeota archaeon]
MEISAPQKKEVVREFLKKGVLISSEVLGRIKESDDLSEIRSMLSGEVAGGISVITEDAEALLLKRGENVNWAELDKLNTLKQKGMHPKPGEKFSSYFSEGIKKDAKTEEASHTGSSKVKVLFSYGKDSGKRSAEDFSQHFLNRYYTIEKILRNRQELKNALSISRILGKKDKENVAAIGFVAEKQTTKNGNVMLSLEDPTGSIKAVVSKSKPELFNFARSLVLDDMVGVSGVNGQKIIFTNSIFLPDIPITHEAKKSGAEEYTIFLSDLHVGSMNFLEDDFNRFLKWINQEIGSEEQRRTASLVRYIFIIGDLVDGCGIYPEQDKELLIKDLNDQYKECARLLGKIPKHIPLIICPGNHDAMRVAEPQLKLYEDFCGPLYELPNAVMVSNPAIINIGSTENFPGFNVLMYHGYSFDHYAAEVDSIRNGGGYDRADLIMKFLLQRRHLAPTHASTLYIPDTDKDHLVIEQIPDFFVSGHIHKATCSNYKNVTMICSSCWQSKTAFQEKVGHNPEPSRAPIVNLQTREVKMLKFGK